MKPSLGDAVADAATGPMVMSIPLRNIWVLMLYASELYAAMGTAFTDVERSPDELPDLVAEILAMAVEHRLRRQLAHGYHRTERVVDRLRGRLDVLATARGQLMQRGKLACRFEVLSVDTPRNRYVSAALRLATRIVRDDSIRHRCGGLARAMQQAGVASDASRRSLTLAQQGGYQDEGDRRMLAAAHLLFELLIPTEGAGSQALHSVARDVVWLRSLYERAVGGLYRSVLVPGGWRVRTGRRLSWPGTNGSPRMATILPGMVTDVELDDPRRASRIIVDTKFNALLVKGRFGADSVRSSHLYQMYAYLRTQESTLDAPSLNASGLLLHPSVGEEIDESLSIQGHRIRFATVDLAASALSLRGRLLALVLADGWSIGHHEPRSLAGAPSAQARDGA